MFLDIKTGSMSRNFLHTELAIDAHVNAVRTPTLCYEIILNLASTKIST
jgi:hypothetical protein